MVKALLFMLVATSCSYILLWKNHLNANVGMIMIKDNNDIVMIIKMQMKMFRFPPSPAQQVIVEEILAREHSDDDL